MLKSIHTYDIGAVLTFSISKVLRRRGLVASSLILSLYAAYQHTPTIEQADEIPPIDAHNHPKLPYTWKMATYNRPDATMLEVMTVIAPATRTQVLYSCADCL